MKARTLCSELEYSEFRHFEPLIARCLNLINNGLEKGMITQCLKEVEIGSGAIRIVKDYDLDHEAEMLIRKMAMGFKMGGNYPIRNETALFSLLKKFCLLNGIDHDFQFKLGDFIYDFRYETTLVEFDETHHATARQTKVDKIKNQTAIDNGYEILRFGFEHDIIDILQGLYFKD